MPPIPALPVLETLDREVDDVTPATRDAIERALFLGLSRHECATHVRHTVHRFALESSNGTTTAHIAYCCVDDSQLEFVVDVAPTIARDHRDEVLKRTRARPGAKFDLDTYVSPGFFRRRRGDRLTLESTLNLRGDERMRPGQAKRFRELIEKAREKGQLDCPLHGRAGVGAVHIMRRKDGTVVDIEVCCTQGRAVDDVIQPLVDDSLLSGPVVAISAGRFARLKRASKR